MRAIVSVTVISAALMLLSSLNALDIEGAKEMACIEIKKTAPMDMMWVLSQKKPWYYPLMSRLDLYLTTASMIDKDVKDMSEDELYYDSCIKFAPEGANFAGYIFDGQKVMFPVKPVRGIEEYQLLNHDGSLFGNCHTTLTDNKTFFFTTCCTDLGYQSWGIVTPLKKLPTDTVQVIHEHAESLGFQKEYFTGLRYDQCEGELETCPQHHADL